MLQMHLNLIGKYIRLVDEGYTMIVALQEACMKLCTGQGEILSDVVYACGANFLNFII